jgi:RNA polymerase sigma-70 factor (ECF subfamily)
VLDTALANLAREERGRGRARLFTALLPVLEGESLPGGYVEVARELGTSEGALKVTAHRLRQRFREHLLQEAAHTLGDAASAGEELRELLAALRAGS